MDEVRERAAVSFVGIEIGGTKVQASLGDAAGALWSIRRGAVRADEGAHGILRWLRGEVLGLIVEAMGSGKPASAIGAGFGGPVDSKAGRVLASHQIEGWGGFALKDWLEQKFGLPAVVSNDANAAGWAEWRLGAGRGTRAFAYMNIGSGIGGALVLDGKLWDGQGWGAGEIGHTRVAGWEEDEEDPRDERDIRRDVEEHEEAPTLESLCSGWAVEKRLRTRPAPVAGSPLGRLCGGRAGALTCEMLGRAAAEGDGAALRELDRIGRSVGMALGNLISLICPERIAIGGGVASIGEPLFGPIRRWADHYAIGVFRGRCQIVPCELQENVVLAGAVLLAGEAAMDDTGFSRRR